MKVKRECEQIHIGIRQAKRFTVGSTAGIWSRNNIGQSRRGKRVKKGIDETKWFAFVFRQAIIIQQREKGRNSLFCGLSVYRNQLKVEEETYGTASTCSVYWLYLVTQNNLKIITLRGDIWICTPCRANGMMMCEIRVHWANDTTYLYSPAYLEPRPSRYLETALVWYPGVEKYREKPPPEKEAAISGLIWVVAPTTVTNGQLMKKWGRYYYMDILQSFPDILRSWEWRLEHNLSCTIIRCAAAKTYPKISDFSVLFRMPSWEITRSRR